MMKVINKTDTIISLEVSASKVRAMFSSFNRDSLPHGVSPISAMSFLVSLKHDSMRSKLTTMQADIREAQATLSDQIEDATSTYLENKYRQAQQAAQFDLQTIESILTNYLS